MLLVAVQLQSMCLAILVSRTSLSIACYFLSSETPHQGNHVLILPVYVFKDWMGKCRRGSRAWHGSRVPVPQKSPRSRDERCGAAVSGMERTAEAGSHCVVPTNLKSSKEDSKKEDLRLGQSPCDLVPRMSLQTRQALNEATTKDRAVASCDLRQHEPTRSTERQYSCTLIVSGAK